MGKLLERRFSMDEAKFATQKTVTYILLAFFACIIANVLFMANDQSERSTVLQTVINLTFLAAGFWLGSSKGAADNREQLNRMMAPQGSTVIATPAKVTVTTEGENDATKP